MSLSRTVLPSGRSIELSELRMTSTYGGMLEGYPCKRVNDLKVAGRLRAAERAFPGTPVHLVPPALTYPEATAGAFGPVETLPLVTCLGLFHSTAIAPDADRVLFRSALAVVWFQATPDVPTEGSTDAGLRDLPWDQLAQDYEL